MHNPLRTNLSLNRPTRSFSTLYNFVFHNIFCCNLYLLRAEAMATGPQTTSPHTIFSRAIQVLLNFLVFKFQNQEKSPFKTHTKTVVFGVINFLLYCLAYDYQQRFSPPSRSTINQVINHCMLLFGYMTIASLTSLLFPDWARSAIYVIYITVSAGELLHLVYQRIRRLFIRGTHFAERQNLPFLICLWRVVSQRTLNRRQLLPR